MQVEYQATQVIAQKLKSLAEAIWQRYFDSSDQTKSNSSMCFDGIVQSELWKNPISFEKVELKRVTPRSAQHKT